MLTLHQIKKRYYTALILDIPQLELPAGIYWIQGANGAGKTTCMKVIAGLIPFEGEALLLGDVSSRRQPLRYRQLVNYAEAEPLYPSFLTGEDLLHLYNTTKGRGRKDLRELAGMLGADAFLQNPVSSYSSGMLKKLSLVLAFAGTPSLILLDEPLITLDSATIPILYEWIRELHTQHGVTFCITSHQPISEALPVTATLAIAHKDLIFL
jgi:ABC-2 type transport system ATP-binding protein